MFCLYLHLSEQPSVLQRMCARKFGACVSVAVFILCSCLVACSWVHCSHFGSVLAIVLPQPMCEFFFKAIPVLLSNVTSLGPVSPIKTSCEVHPKFREGFTKCINLRFKTLVIGNYPYLMMME